VLIGDLEAVSLDPPVYRIVPRSSVVRALTTAALAARRRDDPHRLVKELWPKDAHAAMLVRATVGPTSTLSVTAADLLAAGFAFFSYLPQSAAVALFQRATRLDFRRVN
jgi:hypothetical protein